MTLAIDPLAGTHFIGKKIEFSTHAIKAAIDRFKVAEKDAASFIALNLRKASFVDVVTSDDGEQRRLFAFQRIAFIVALNEDVVVTLYPNHSASETVRRPLEKAAAKILAAAQRTEKRECKRIAVAIAELNVKRAETLLRKTKTTSRRVEIAADTAIAAIDEEVAGLERKMIEIKREKTSLVKGLVAYL